MTLADTGRAVESESSGASLGLSDRPTVPPEVMAVIAAAIDQAWPRAVVVEAGAPPDMTWRFSGRWWSQPGIRRRPRP